MHGPLLLYTHTYTDTQMEQPQHMALLPHDSSSFFLFFTAPIPKKVGMCVKCTQTILTNADNQYQYICYRSMSAENIGLAVVDKFSFSFLLTVALLLISNNCLQIFYNIINSIRHLWNIKLVKKEYFLHFLCAIYISCACITMSYCVIGFNCHPDSLYGQGIGLYLPLMALNAIVLFISV